jgi:hypothetical protein
MNGLVVCGPSATQQSAVATLPDKRSRMQALESHSPSKLAYSKARTIFLLNRRKHFESSSVASLQACVLDIKRWRVNTCAREPRAPGPRATSACTTRRSIVSRGLTSKSKQFKNLKQIAKSHVNLMLKWHFLWNEVLAYASRPFE